MLGLILLLSNAKYSSAVILHQTRTRILKVSSHHWSIGVDTINRNCVLNLRKLVLKVSSGGSLTVDQHQCKLLSWSKIISA